MITIASWIWWIISSSKGEKLTPFTVGPMALVLLSLLSRIYLTRAWTSMFPAADFAFPFEML